MTFENDEFVKNVPRKFGEKSFVQTEEQLDISYPQPRPIGQLLAQSKDLASGNLELGISGTMDDA